MSEASTQLQTVNVTRSEGAATIELNRPQALNAWNEQFGIDLLATVRELAQDETVRAVAVTGAGGRADDARRARARVAGAGVGHDQPRGRRRRAGGANGGARGAPGERSDALLRGCKARAQQLAVRAHGGATGARGAPAAGDDG